MITGIDLTEVMDYSCVKDTAETKTVFKVSAISSPVQARVGRLAGADGTGALDCMIEAFKFGVKGIVNFQNSKGVPIQFKTEDVLVDGEKCQVVSRETLNVVPLNIISEVGAKIISISNLTEKEIKN